MREPMCELFYMNMSSIVRQESFHNAAIDYIFSIKGGEKTSADSGTHRAEINKRCVDHYSPQQGEVGNTR